jgi:hypothetical protein
VIGIVQDTALGFATNYRFLAVLAAPSRLDELPNVAIRRPQMGRFDIRTAYESTMLLFVDQFHSENARMERQQLPDRSLALHSRSASLEVE